MSRNTITSLLLLMLLLLSARLLLLLFTPMQLLLHDRHFAGTAACTDYHTKANVSHAFCIKTCKNHGFLQPLAFFSHSPPTYPGIFQPIQFTQVAANCKAWLQKAAWTWLQNATWQMMKALTWLQNAKTQNTWYNTQSFNNTGIFQPDMDLQMSSRCCFFFARADLHVNKAALPAQAVAKIHKWKTQI